jgi:hypothetical protein
MTNFISRPVFFLIEEKIPVGEELAHLKSRFKESTCKTYTVRKTVSTRTVVGSQVVDGRRFESHPSTACRLPWEQWWVGGKYCGKLYDGVLHKTPDDINIISVKDYLALKNKHRYAPWILFCPNNERFYQREGRLGMGAGSGKYWRRMLKNIALHPTARLILIELLVDRRDAAVS